MTTDMSDREALPPSYETALSPMGDSPSGSPGGSQIPDSLSERLRDTLGAVSPIASTPSPLDVLGQQKRLSEPPDASAVGGPEPVGYYYLKVDFVRPELDAVFGNGNWTLLHHAGYPRSYSSPTKTKGGSEQLVIIDYIQLIVRWANGNLQAIEGMGEARLQLSSARASIVATTNAATSEALKAAAKYLGRRFGSALRDDIHAGLLDNAETAAGLSQILAAINQTYWWGKEQRVDVLIDRPLMEELAEKYGGSKLDALDAKGVRNLLAVLNECVSVAEAKALEADAKKYVLKMIKGEGYIGLRKRVEKARQEEVNALGI